MRRFRPSRLAITASLAAVFVLGPATAAFACGGLIAPNGTISLLRTTTLAAYHRGIEHYITSFTFSGTATEELGSIVPLPGVPTTVKPAGEWTLQRLVLETSPPVFEEVGFAVATDGAALHANVLFETEIDALDITVLEGGAVAVGNWAREHGFFLPPDAPEVLEFYAARSPIFMAVRFNAERAAEQGIQEGEGTPVHAVIPTPNPWVPLRILGLGLDPDDIVRADVYLLTDIEPAMLPQAKPFEPGADQRGIVLERSVDANETLLTDLASDRGMKWLPTSDMWLSHLTIDIKAGNLTHDLAIDASGYGHPSPIAAGLDPPVFIDPVAVTSVLFLVLATLIVLVPLVLASRRRGVVTSS
jgi:hypothetical protein